LINEKGCVNAAGGLGLAPVGFADRAHAVLAGVGRSTVDLESAIAQVTELVEATHKACDSAEREAASAER
jgi:tetrahydromethanopterin S-methyltransferase subunit D